MDTTLGHLGHPLVKVKAGAENKHGYYSGENIAVCRKIIEENDLGKDLLERLKTNELLKPIIDTQLNYGTFASRLTYDEILIWYAWIANTEGVDAAETYLSDFIKSDTINIISTLWITGIRIEEIIDLNNGVQLVPLEKVDDSADKENYILDSFKIHPIYNHPKVSAAIQIKHSVEKIFTEFSSNQLIADKLELISRLINLLPGVSCSPIRLTSYAASHVPSSLFRNADTISGKTYHAVYQRNNVFPTAQTQRLINLIDKFCIISNKQKWNVVLDRLSEAKRKNNIIDKVLDLGIALEMMLLDGSKDQLTIQFKTRGAWLISRDYDERVNTFDLLGELYNYRSEVAHTGIIKKIERADRAFPSFLNIAEQIGQKLIIDNTPDWKKTTLGG